MSDSIVLRQFGDLVLLNGNQFDFPPAMRHFQRFTHEQRADMRASHRLGFRQREQVGEVFWTHPLCPGICFPTSTRALEAAVASQAQPSSAVATPNKNSATTSRAPAGALGEAER